MRKFTMVSPMLWKDRRFRGLSSQGAKLTMLYLITSPHQNSAGCYHLPDGYASADMGISEADYRGFRKEVVDAGLVIFDEDTSEIFIVGWFEDNPVTNENHYQGCERLVMQIESEKVGDAAQAALQQSEDRRHAATQAKARRRSAPAPDVPSEDFGHEHRRVG